MIIIEENIAKLNELFLKIDILVNIPGQQLIQGGNYSIFYKDDKMIIPISEGLFAKLRSSTRYPKLKISISGGTMN